MKISVALPAGGRNMNAIVAGSHDPGNSGARMKRIEIPDVTDMKPRVSRMLRLRWGLDPATVAGRADILMKDLQGYEAGRLRHLTPIWRVNLAKALRQLAYERAQDTVKEYGAAIAADPDAELYTREAAKVRRVLRYGHDDRR
jgi:hypothetical protein